MSNQLNLIVPIGMFGRTSNEPTLNFILRSIGVKFDKDAEANWAEKYGTNFENEKFMMHKFCWCEQDDCIWCAGCDCPESAFHYYVDGVECTYKEWMNFYYRETTGANNQAEYTAKIMNMKDFTEHFKIADQVNKRRETKKDDICDYCTGNGIFSSPHCEPGEGAANFWYKPLDFKVWWYKYIGRGMKTNKTLTDQQLVEMQADIFLT